MAKRILVPLDEAVPAESLVKTIGMLARAAGFRPAERFGSSLHYTQRFVPVSTMEAAEAGRAPSEPGRPRLPPSRRSSSRRAAPAEGRATLRWSAG